MCIGRLQWIVCRVRDCRGHIAVTFHATFAVRAFDASCLAIFLFGPRSSVKSGVERDMTSDEDRKRLMGSASKLLLVGNSSSSGIVSGEVGERDLSGEKLVRLFVLSLMSISVCLLPTLRMQGSELMVTRFSGVCC